MKISSRLFSQRNLIIMLFLVFLFLRLFVNSSEILLGSDNLKYLIMANNFPYHTTANNQMEINHGPFYPYVIHFFALIIGKDYITSILVSLLSACIAFFMLYRLFMMLSGNFYVTYAAMALFTLSDELIIAAHAPLKESFTIMLIISSLYFFIKGVKYYDRKSIWMSALAGSMLALSVDHVIFLLPAFALSYIFFNKGKIDLWKFHFPNLKYAAIPFVITLLVYASWLGARAYQYSQDESYPAGLEGTPLFAKNFGIVELLNPVYFKDYDPGLPHGFNTRIRNYAFGLGYMFNLEPFAIPRGLNLMTMKYLLFPRHIAYMILIYLPLAAMAAYAFFSTIKDSIKTRKIHKNPNLYLILVFLVFMFPLTQKVNSPRYIYTDYLLLYYFIGLGFFMLLKKNNKLRLYNKVLPLSIILLFILLPFWHYHNNHLAIFAKKNAETSNTAEFVRNNLANSAIMAQPGYVYDLIYLTQNRVLGLPPFSKDLLYFIEHYDVDYVVFGRYYTSSKYFYSKDTIEYIKNNPQKFRLVKTVKEDYSRFFSPEDNAATDEVYVYKVIR